MAYRLAKTRFIHDKYYLSQINMGGNVKVKSSGESTPSGM